MTQIGRRTSGLGIAKETGWGTPVPATNLYPVTDIRNQPTYEVIIEQGLRGQGSRDLDALQGGGHGELSIEGWVYPEEIGLLLLPMFGAVGTSGMSAPFTHTFSRGDAPGSVTIEEALGTGASLALIYAGCRPGEMAFSFDAGTGVLTYSSTLMSKNPTKGTFAAPADAAAGGFAGWRGVVTSTGLSSILISAEFTISRELQVVHTAQNSQVPYAINVGPIGIDGRFVIVAEDLTDFDVWTAFTEQSFSLDFQVGAGAALKQFQLTCANVNLANGPFEIDRSNVGVTYGIPFIALHNATDAGPGRIILQNSKNAY
jgi:hypothetical protein